MTKEWLEDTEKTDDGYVVITWERILQELWVLVKTKLLSEVVNLDEGNKLQLLE